MPSFDPFGSGFGSGTVSGNQYQRQQDFNELRREYRAAALTALRRREGLPLPVDEHGQELETRFDDLGQAHYYNAAGEKVEKVMWQGAGKDGKPGGLAVGKRRGVAIADADQHWGSPDAGFEILDIAEDGRKLADELADLDRDAAAVELSQRISHGPAVEEQAPDFHLTASDDATVDEELQAYIRRQGERQQ